MVLISSGKAKVAFVFLDHCIYVCRHLMVSHCVLSALLCCFLWLVFNATKSKYDIWHLSINYWETLFIYLALILR